MNVHRLTVWAVSCALALGAAAPAMASEQAWPAKPIKLIIPFPPGGPTDSLGRQFAEKLRASLGESVIVENVGGANGSIGMSRVASAAPDGYTLGLGAVGTQVINPLLYPNPPYDTFKDFSPISLVSEYVNVLVVNQELPVKSVADLIDYAKKNPGKVTYGSAGQGSSNHLSAALFASSAGIEATHVPYRGSAPALVDLMAGNTTFMFDVMVNSMPQVRAGKLRALAVSGAKPDPQVPELPPVAQTLPGYEVLGWFALYGPPGMPKDIVTKLSQATAAISQDAELTASMAKQGFNIAASTPEQLTERMAKDIETLGPVIKASGAKVE